MYDSVHIQQNANKKGNRLDYIQTDLRQCLNNNSVAKEKVSIDIKKLAQVSL
jgi:hypothetical protein